MPRRARGTNAVGWPCDPVLVVGRPRSLTGLISWRISGAGYRGAVAPYGKAASREKLDDGVVFNYARTGQGEREPNGKKGISGLRSSICWPPCCS